MALHKEHEQITTGHAVIIRRHDEAVNLREIVQLIPGTGVSFFSSGEKIIASQKTIIALHQNEDEAVEMSAIVDEADGGLKIAVGQPTFSRWLDKQSKKRVAQFRVAFGSYDEYITIWGASAIETNNTVRMLQDILYRGN